MAQSMWHRDDIARIGQTLIAMAPTPDFAAGVAALCNAVGAKVQLPERCHIVEVALINGVVDGNSTGTAT